MNIYLLTRPGGGYDTFKGHVVVAADETAARDLVPCADECEAGYSAPLTDPERPTHACIWQDPARSTCERIGTAAKGHAAGVVLSDFNAG